MPTTRDSINAEPEGYKKYNNRRVNPREFGKRKHIQYSCNHPCLPHFENSHLYARYLHATAHIFEFKFYHDNELVGHFKRVTFAHTHFHWYVEKDFKSSVEVFHGKRDIGYNHEGETVKVEYLLDYMGLKFWKEGIEYIILKIEVVDTFRGAKWLEIPRSYIYEMKIRGRNCYDIKPITDDTGIESLEQLGCLQHTKRKRQLHKGRRGAPKKDNEWTRWKRMKHADDCRSQVQKGYGNCQTIDYSEFKRVEK